MKRITTYTAAAMLVGGSWGATSALAAAPVPGAPDCRDQVACVYRDRHYGGKFEHKGAGAPLTQTSQDNVMSSWMNKTFATGSWWMGVGSDYCYTMGPRRGNPSLSMWQNDRMSSWQMSTGCKE